MKLIDVAQYEDYGHEWFLQVLSFHRKFALLDITVQWDEYAAPEFFPLLVLSLGNRCLFGFTFRWKWFEFSFEFIDTLPRDLEWYRRGGYMYEDID